MCQRVSQESRRPGARRLQQEVAARKSSNSKPHHGIPDQGGKTDEDDSPRKTSDSVPSAATSVCNLVRAAWPLVEQLSECEVNIC